MLRHRSEKMSLQRLVVVRLLLVGHVVEHRLEHNALTDATTDVDDGRRSVRLGVGVVAICWALWRGRRAGSAGPSGGSSPPAGVSGAGAAAGDAACGLAASAGVLAAGAFLLGAMKRSFNMNLRTLTVC